MLTRFFLDLAASLPPYPPAAEILKQAAFDGLANPAAPHREGKRTRALLDESRQRFATLLGVRSDQIIFTSGGTEAAHLAIGGTLAKASPGHCRVVVTAVEHPAILSAAHRFAGPDHVDIVPCRPDGTVPAEAVLQTLREDTALVAFQAANLDSGAIHHPHPLAEELAKRNIPWLCDAQALFGLAPVNWHQLQPDLLILTAHRFGGPKGCGLLLVRDRSRLAAIQGGGRQESGLRAGTENVSGIVAAALAAEMACQEAAARAAQQTHQQHTLLHHLRSAIPSTRLLGPEPGPGRIPGHLALIFGNADAESLAFMLDLRGLAIGVGSGCLSPHEKVSGVFKAMGLSTREALGAILLGMPPNLTEADIHRIVAEFQRAVARIENISANQP